MRIGISGCQNIGKSTLIKDFLEKWDMYETPEKSYRDVAKEKGLKLNQETTPESQTIILDCLCDQVMGKDRLDNIITDRTPYDALAYSLWAHQKGVAGFDEAFIAKQIALAKEASSFYDIIFHIPIVPDHDVALVEDGLRDTDPEFRTEMDNIFSAIFSTYFTQQGPFFKWEDCPAVIEVFGNPAERMEMLKLYINEDGVCFGEEDSLVTDALTEVDEGEVPEIVV